MKINRDTDLALHEFSQTRERQRRLVDFAHEEPLQYHLIEIAISPPHEKSVQLVIMDQSGVNLMKYMT